MHEADPDRLGQLEARMKRLEGRLEQLALQLDKVARQQTDWDRLNSLRMKLIEEDQDDAFNRLKNIELKVFPNLAQDILRVNDIIGDGGNKRHNGLDYRKPEA